MATDAQLSSYLAHLPASFQVDPFLGRFLLAFERILTGSANDQPLPVPLPPTLEQSYQNMAVNLSPAQAPTGFLPWLATWVATSLRDDWSEDLRRRFIGRMASLYRKRGTKSYLQELLALYLNDDDTVKSIVIDDSMDTPHFFTVSFTLSIADPDQIAYVAKLAVAIIDQEKPAHTYYQLSIFYPELQLLDNPDPPKHPGVVVGQAILGTMPYTKQKGSR